MQLDPQVCYPLLAARDRRYDGVFYVGVTSTGVYCRPICPAQTPGPDRCRYFPNAATAEAEGFRACKRCRPERAPGHAPADAASRLARRAVVRIEAGALDGGTLAAMATGLGVTDRHLRRTFHDALGVSPQRYVTARRTATARELLRETSLSLPEVARAVGFGSVRRLQAALRDAGTTATAVRGRATGPAAVEVTLDARPPLDLAHLLGFLAARAVPGVERVDPDGYARAVRIGGRTGVVRVAAAGTDAAPRVRVSVCTALAPVLMQVVGRVRATFDLDAHPAAIVEHLGDDPVLGRSVRAWPGTRLPGTFDPVELAVRAILGQQVSVRAATTLAGRLVAAVGEPLSGEVELGEDATEPGITRLFPTAWRLAEVGPDAIGAIGLPAARARAIHALAAAVAEDRVDLEPGADPEQTAAALQALPGIGPWTASYVAMRALGWTDGFLPGDLVVRRALGAHSARAAEVASARWRPWRAYAVMHLWRSPVRESEGVP